MKKILSLFLLLTATAIKLDAQFVIVPKPVLPAFVTPTGLTDVTIYNSSTSVNVGMRVVITEAGGGEILTLITQPFLIENGMNDVVAANYGYITLNYASSNKAQYLQLNQKLVSGVYEICYALVDNQGEGFSEVCSFIDAGIFSNLTLLFPPDEDTINNLNPVLIWNHTETFDALGENEYFELKLCEVQPQQTPVEAISQNVPHLLLTPVMTHHLPYPMDATSLVNNKEYVWQVSKYHNESVIQQTEVWTFNTFIDSLPKDKMYAKLTEKRDAGYFNVQDNTLYFMFDNHYQHGENDHLKYEILNYKNEVVFSHDHTLNDEPLIHLGKNKFSFNLNEMGIPQGNYTLKIRGSTIYYYLQFKTN